MPMMSSNTKPHISFIKYFKSKKNNI